MPKRKRGYFGSTEAAARKVEEGIKKRSKKKASKKKPYRPTRPTATSPKGVQKTKAQGEKERAALRKKQRERIEAAKKKARKK